MLPPYVIGADGHYSSATESVGVTTAFPLIGLRFEFSRIAVANVVIGIRPQFERISILVKLRSDFGQITAKFQPPPTTSSTRVGAENALCIPSYCVQHKGMQSNKSIYEE